MTEIRAKPNHSPLPGWLRRLIQESISFEELSAIEALARNGEGSGDREVPGFDPAALFAATAARREAIAERLADGSPTMTKRLTSAGIAHFARRIQRAEGRIEVEAIVARARIRYPDHPRIFEIEGVARQRIHQMERWANLAAPSAAPTRTAGITEG